MVIQLVALQRQTIRVYYVSGWVGPGLTRTLFLENHPKIALKQYCYFGVEYHVYSVCICIVKSYDVSVPSMTVMHLQKQFECCELYPIYFGFFGMFLTLQSPVLDYNTSVIRAVISTAKVCCVDINIRTETGQYTEPRFIKHKQRNEDMYRQINMLPIVQVVNKNKFRWFGHVMRRDEESTMRVGLNLDM